MLKTFDVTHFRRYVTPPDNTSKQIRRFAFSVIDVYKVLGMLYGKAEREKLVPIESVTHDLSITRCVPFGSASTATLLMF